MKVLLAGALVVNGLGATALYIVLYKYPGESFSAALWGLGAVLGYMICSARLLQRIVPTENGDRTVVGYAVTGLLTANFIAWFLALGAGMFAADGESLMQDFRVIGMGIYDRFMALVS